MMWNRIRKNVNGLLLIALLAGIVTLQAGCNIEIPADDRYADPFRSVEIQIDDDEWCHDCDYDDDYDLPGSIGQIVEGVIGIIDYFD